jgi:hypothetical protein
LFFFHFIFFSYYWPDNKGHATCVFHAWPHCLISFRPLPFGLKFDMLNAFLSIIECWISCFNSWVNCRKVKMSTFTMFVPYSDDMQNRQLLPFLALCKNPPCLRYKPRLSPASDINSLYCESSPSLYIINQNYYVTVLNSVHSVTSKLHPGYIPVWPLQGWGASLARSNCTYLPVWHLAPGCGL